MLYTDRQVGTQIHTKNLKENLNFVLRKRTKVGQKAFETNQK